MGNLSPVKFHDYYKTLGVARDASQEEIQKAYRALARKYHPDVNKEPEAETTFKRVSEAYEVLKDPEKRRRYDQLGPNFREGQDFRPPPGWQGAQGGFGGAGGGDFSDFFEAIFGGLGGMPGGMGGGGMGGMGGMSGGAAAGPRPGRTSTADLTISLDEAIKGSTRSIGVTGPDGAARTIDVQVPPGTITGSKIRLRGQGAPGLRGGAPGDLMLRVSVAAHPRFRVDGRTLIATLPIAPYEAVLGAKVALETPTGEVTLSIPPGSQSGQRLRLKGRGIPGGPGGGQQPDGDLLAELRIVVPKEVSSEERELYERLAGCSNFDPRRA